MGFSRYGDGYLLDVFKVRVPSGRFHRLTTIKPEINDCKPAHWSLSPDRKWLLWLHGHNERNEPGAYQIHASRIDGYRTLVWTMGNDFDLNSLFWFPDGRHIASVVGIMRDSGAKAALTRWHVTIYDRWRPRHPPRVVSLPSAENATYLGISLEGRLLVTCEPLEGTGQGSKKGTFEIQELSLTGKKAVCVRRLRIRLPKGSTGVFEVALSPDSRRLFWTLNGDAPAVYGWGGIEAASVRPVNFPTAHEERYLDAQDDIRFVGWGYDGRSVLFHAHGKDRDALYQVPLR